MIEDLSPWINQQIEQIDETQAKISPKTKKIFFHTSMIKPNKEYQFMYFKGPSKSLTRQDFNRPFVQKLQISRKQLKFHVKFTPQKLHIPTKTTLASKYYSRKLQNCQPLLKSNSTPYFISKIDEFIKQNTVLTKNYQRPTRTVNYIRKNTKAQIDKSMIKQASFRIKKIQKQHFLDRILSKLS